MFNNENWRPLTIYNYKSFLLNDIIFSLIGLIISLILLVILYIFVYSSQGRQQGIIYDLKEDFYKGLQININEKISISDFLMIIGPLWIYLIGMLILLFVDIKDYYMLPKEYYGSCIIQYIEKHGRGIKTPKVSFLGKNNESYRVGLEYIEKYDPTPGINGKRNCTMNNIQFNYLSSSKRILVDTISVE